MQEIPLRLDIAPDRVVSFRDYAPQVFRYLRNRVFDITDDDFLASVSLTDEEDFKNATAKSSEGASGYAIDWLIGCFCLFV